MKIKGDTEGAETTSGTVFRQPRKCRRKILVKPLSSTETLGTCPECHALCTLQVVLNTDTVEYRGMCKDHGEFVRTENRLDMSDLGVSLSSNVGISGQKESA